MIEFVGELLAPYAVQLVARISGRFGYDRWRIDRLVRRSSGLMYPRREFRKWLKSLSEAQLSKPVEEAGPELALDLDQALSDAGRQWTRKRGRTSEALRLVEATYAASLEILSGQKALVLVETWNRCRNDTVVARLVEIARTAGWQTLRNDDIALVLKRKSWERRRVRLRAFDIADNLHDAVLRIDPNRIPEIGPAALNILVGPFGAGKSEIAEAWHMQRILEFESASDARMPI